MFLLIDNYDSFTYNLLHYLGELGAEVEQGEILVRLDDGPLRAQVGEAAAAWKVSRAAVVRAKAEHRALASELARKAPLAEDDLVSPLEMDNLRSRHDAARAALEVASAQVDQAAAHLQRLRQDLGDTRLTAPFAGRVAGRLLDPGAVVSSGTTILRLVHTDPAVARFRLSEEEVGLLHALRGAEKQLEVLVTVPAYRGRQWRGKLVRLAPALEVESRAAEAEAEIPNPDGALMPGMYCRLGIELGERADLVLLPLVALMDGESEGPSVFVVRGSKAHKVSVGLGIEGEGHGEVLEGLSPGDVVGVEGQDRLREGRDVRIVAPGADAGPKRGQGAERR